MRKTRATAAAVLVACLLIGLSAPAGAGVILSTPITTSGTNPVVLSTTGTLTPGNCLEIDADGNAVDAGAACGTGGGGGSPGGTTGAIQYRDGGGDFAGAVITGIVKGNGTSAPSAAVAGTDYISPGGLGTGVATFLGTPTGNILAGWLASGAAAANLGFTPPPNTRNVSTSGLLTGGGNLTADRTISIAAQNACTVVANATGGSAAPTAVTLGSGLSCSGGQLVASGGGGAIDVGDGTTTVSPADEITFGTGFKVTDAGGGEAVVTLTGALADKSGSGQAIVAGDAGKTVEVGAFTYTLAQAGTTGFETGWGACLVNVGAGNATLNATTSTFQGGGGSTSMTLAPNTWACPTSDGTNYTTIRGGGGTGDVVGPASAVNDRIAAFDGTTGKLLKDGGILTSSVLVSGGALGTPTSGTLTNATGLPVGGIASIAANTVVGNATGGAASPTALSVPDCDASNEALQYTAGAGFSCEAIAGSGTPGGSSGDIQYNNAGAFGGRAPSGNGTTVVTTTGAQTSGRCVEIDANGNHIAAAAACGSGGGNTASAISFSGGVTTTNNIMGISIAGATTNTSRPIIAPYNLTLSDLACVVSSAPGAGITWTFTLRTETTLQTNQVQNIIGASQTQTDGLQTGDTNTPVNVSKGNRITIHFATTSGSPAPSVSCTMKSVPQ